MALGLVVGLAGVVSGQEPETRAEVLRLAREAKQQTLQPYQPNALERAMDLAEDRVVPLLQRDGFYAKFGSLTTGSGTAIGAGFRDRSLVNGFGALDLWAARSLEGYWALDARAHYPLVPGDEVVVDAHARRYGYPQEAFFGLGPDTSRRSETNYSQRGTAFGLDLNLRPSRRLSTGGGVEVLRPTTAPGRSGDDLSIEERFTDVEVPGLISSTTFLRSAAFVEYDYRQPLNARRGGFYRVDLSRYADRDEGRFSFTQATLDLRQFVSVLAERRVLATRLWVATTEPVDDGRVPFFLMPTLGGNETLRGFRAFRFRGRHAILLQGEYRWEIWSGLEAALFYDAGKVADRRADLNLRRLERDYGFGFRFNTDDGIIMRVDAAFGSRDGKHLHVVFGGIF